jgi:hypothetical protein
MVVPVASHCNADPGRKSSNHAGFEWVPFRTSVREIEKKTKLKFFTNVPEDVAKELKEDVDDDHIGPPPSRSAGRPSGASCPPTRCSPWPASGQAPPPRRSRRRTSSPSCGTGRTLPTGILPVAP